MGGGIIEKPHICQSGSISVAGFVTTVSACIRLVVRAVVTFGTFMGLFQRACFSVDGVWRRPTGG